MKKCTRSLRLLFAVICLTTLIFLFLCSFLFNWKSRPDSSRSQANYRYYIQSLISELASACQSFCSDFHFGIGQFSNTSNSTAAAEFNLIHPRNKEWYNYTKSKLFIFHGGSDSPGGDMYVSSLGEKDIQELTELCRSTHGCFGYTSDGILKQKLLPYRNWTNLNSKEKGLYVLDIDYCSSDYEAESVCPNTLICVTEPKGRYSCEPKLLAKTTQEQLVTIDAIHVVLSVDKAQFPGVLPLLHSMKQHNQNKKLVVHIVVNSQDKKEFAKLLSCGFQKPSNFKMNIVEFDVPNSLKQLIKVKRHVSLSSTANFARFYFHELFPNLSHVLYLDVDVLVLHDLSEIWSEIISTEHTLLVVVPRNLPRFGFHFPKSNVSQLFLKRYGKTINMSSPTFNAGVLGFNLNKWRADNVIEEVIYWMKENKNTPLWFQGTQPILYLVGYDNWRGVDTRWNVDGLGWTRVPTKMILKAYILHWSGAKKPWLKTTLRYSYLWRKYNKGICNKRGKCREGKDGKGICDCSNGFKGDNCEKKILA